MYRLFLATVIPLLFVVSTAKAQEPELPQAIAGDTIPCPIGLPAGEVEGETVVCGQIEVPQNWDEPDGTTITLAYAVMRSPSQAPFLDPVLFFHGGPGESAISTYEELAETFSGLRHNRDVIIWDQRGSAYSGNLSCPGDVRIADVERYEAQQALNTGQIATYNANSDPALVYTQTLAYLSTDDYSQCLPLWEAQGIDITQYSTENTVRDTLALMDHLGYPAYTLYGISYGTRVLLEVAQFYTDHPELELLPVRTAVIDGVVARDADWYEQGITYPNNILRVFTDCEADPACSEAYPDIRQRAIDLLAALDEAPLLTEDGTEVTLEEVVEMMKTTVMLQKHLVPLLPRLVDELERGVVDTFLTMRAFIATPLFGLDEEPASPVGRDPSDINATLEQLDEIQNQLADYAISAEIIAQAALEATSRPTYFQALYEQLIFRKPLAQTFSASVLESAVIDPEKRTRDTLQTATIGFQYEGVKQEAQALVDTMTDKEIAEVYDLLLRPELLNPLRLLNDYILHIVDCNDRGYTFDTEEAFAVYAAYEAPQLVQPRVSLITEFQIRCEQLGIASDGYSPPPPPATSDWPFLVTNGSLDFNAPPEWGENAFETLPNAKMITFPLQGHAATILSQCAEDIVSAYVLNPDTALNLSCLEAMRPDYVLPDAELPALPEPLDLGN